jgi:hypothetical protein
MGLVVVIGPGNPISVSPAQNGLGGDATVCNRRVLNSPVEIKGDSIYDVITLLGSIAGAVFLANVLFFLPLLCSSQSPTLFSDSYPVTFCCTHNRISVNPSIG